MNSTKNVDELDALLAKLHNEIKPYLVQTTYTTIYYAYLDIRMKKSINKFVGEKCNQELTKELTKTMTESFFYMFPQITKY